MSRKIPAGVPNILQPKEDSNLLALLAKVIDLFVKPARLFESLNRRASFAFPFLLVLIGTLLNVALYYSRVDSLWLTARLFDGMPHDQFDAMRQMATPALQKWSAVIGTCVATVIFYLLTALYFAAIGKFLGIRKRFGDWFCFFSWTNLPSIFSVAASTLYALTMPPQTMPDAINVTHLNPLLIQLSRNNPYFGMTTSFDLLTFWTITLGAIGWKKWTNRSWVNAIVISTLPTLAFYVAWALIANFFA